jgi:parallel beta-helix repeat protein
MAAKALIAVVVAAAVVLLATTTSTDRGDRRARAPASGRHPAGSAPRVRLRASLARGSPAHCDRFAAPVGSPDGDGSSAHPVRGPAGLVRLLGAGETGCLRTGTYVERETIVRREAVTLRSAPGERALWRGRIVLRGAGDRLLELDLDGSAGPRCAQPDCATLPSPTIHAADVWVASNDITNHHSGICVHPRSWGDQRPDGFHIVGNRVHDCGRLPATDHDHGIYVADGVHGEVRGNVVYDNADRGIQLYPNARFTTVVHNTVDGNGSGLVVSRLSAGNVVRDNVFTNSIVRWNAETFRLTGAGNRFSGNCVRASNADAEYDTDGGVALPPSVLQTGTRVARDRVYADRGRGDFRVLTTSACAGKGAPASIAVGRESG